MRTGLYANQAVPVCQLKVCPSVQPTQREMADDSTRIYPLRSGCHTKIAYLFQRTAKWPHVLKEISDFLLRMGLTCMKCAVSYAFFFLKQINFFVAVFSSPSPHRLLLTAIFPPTLLGFQGISGLYLSVTARSKV